jgi:hypothetical protein
MKIRMPDRARGAMIRDFLGTLTPFLHALAEEIQRLTTALGALC